MADRGWLTLADVWKPQDPLDVAMKVQQLESARRQNRLNAIAAREQDKSSQGFDLWQAGGMKPPSGLDALLPLEMAAQGPTQLGDAAMSQAPMGPPQGAPGGGGAQPMPISPDMPQGAPALPISEGAQQPDLKGHDKESLMRGQQKINSLMPIVKKALKNPGEEADIVNKAFDMYSSDEDMQNVSDVAGIKMSGFADKEKKKARFFIEKNYTRSELDELSNSYKGRGGDYFNRLPEGKYEVEFNPVTDVIAGFKTVEEEEEMEGNMLKLINQALHAADPKVRKKAEENLAKLRQHQTQLYSEKYGELTPEGVGFMAQQYIDTGKNPGRGQRMKIAVYNEVARLAALQGLTVAEIIEKRATIKGFQTSLNQQLKSRGALGVFIRTIDMQEDKILGLIEKIKRADVRALNIPWHEFQTKIVGNPNEAVLSMYFEDLSTEVAKTVAGTTGSIQQLPEGARQKWGQIHDVKLSTKALPKLLKETMDAARMRVIGLDDEIEFTRDKLRGVSPKEKLPTYDLGGTYGSGRQGDAITSPKSFKIDEYVVEVVE